jgi:site-specific recombinase XerD
VGTYQVALGSFYAHLKTLCPKNPLASLTKSQVQDYLLRLCERDLVPYTKVNTLLAVKKYLQWEVQRGTYSEDLLEVLDRSKLPAIPEYLPRPLSAENDQILQKIWRDSQSPYAPLFLLLRHTGMRISELIHLPSDCVLTGSGNEKYLKIPLGKMNTERWVPLSEESLQLIQKIRQQCPPKTPAHRLIGMKGRVPQVYARLSHQFKKLSGNLHDQNKRVTFHRLRHTYATTLLSAGVSLVSLMKLLGHRRIEMTLRYAKVTPSHLRDEYLKAIQILEQQAGRNPTAQHTGSAGEQTHPATLITQIAAFVTKAASQIEPSPKKNLLLRLSRLQKDLSQIHFSQTFKLHEPREEARAD